MASRCIYFFLTFFLISIRGYSQDSIYMESSDFSIEQNIDTLYIAAENAVRNKSDRSLEYCLRALRIAKQESNELYEGMILLLMSQYSLDVKNYES